MIFFIGAAYSTHGKSKYNERKNRVFKPNLKNHFKLYK